MQDRYSRTQSGQKMLSRHHGKTRPGLTKGEEESQMVRKKQRRNGAGMVYPRQNKDVKR